VLNEGNTSMTLSTLSRTAAALGYRVNPENVAAGCPDGFAPESLG
jgi:hypothetical protein